MSIKDSQAPVSAVALRPPYPMLAKTGKITDLAGAVARGYQIEPKIDGIRCLAVVSATHGVQLYNRQLVNITARFPDIVRLLQEQCGGGVLMLGKLVLDGEICVLGAHGHADFQLVQHRANRILKVAEAAEAYPATFMAFDVLSSGHVSYMSQPLEARRRILQEVAGPLVVPVLSQGHVDRLVGEGKPPRQDEGVMLKALGGKYEPATRSGAWLKVKWEHEIEGVVGGVTWGIGKREPYFGGLLIGLPQPEDAHGTARLAYVGTVGTGFTDETLEDLTVKLGRLRTTTNPFVNNGETWDLKHFVAPVLRARVRFSNWSSARVMRFPRYIGLVERKR